MLMELESIPLFSEMRKHNSPSISQSSIVFIPGTRAKEDQMATALDGGLRLEPAEREPHLDFLPLSYIP